ncbi:sigma-54-dependent Fis family transcriptional regulator [Ottowia sp.]|uniref:sigma-54 interaction domain-containing protein n=1 Tax=Ottowia sp. TaxID=1898956 RepID=UPI00261AEF8A|nr:sigma-54-dependent Fis family transcriptional regulator [Ottowia sp.]
MKQSVKEWDRLVAYLEALPEPHIVFDSQYRILAANRAYRRAFASDGSVVGHTCYEVSHHTTVPCDMAGESCPMAKARESGQRERVLHLHHTAQGESYVDIEIVPLQHASGGATWYVEKMAPLRIALGRPARQGLIGRAPSFVRMLEMVARVAPSSASVLLLGESGTGKELVAHAIHEASKRAEQPIVAVDCASLTESLFESELFGHERGAFTGALQSRIGLVESASGGTLFLDEVGDIPLPMQVKLLRLLESGTYRRVGSTDVRRADVRVIAATHRDLRAMIAEGTFREDLYFRLSAFPIQVPPLRERSSDIALIAPSLLQRTGSGKPLQITADAMALLQAHPLPGNVRQLRNVLERAGLLADAGTVGVAEVRQALAFDTPLPTAGPPSAAGAGVQSPASTTLQAITDAALQAIAASHQGSRAELAQQLGMSERTLYRKLQHLGRPD